MAMSLGPTNDGKKPTNSPSEFNKNFPKFSESGDPLISSSHLKTGSISGPTTETYSRMGKLTLWVLHAHSLIYSDSNRKSFCPVNELDGNAKIYNP